MAAITETSKAIATAAPGRGLEDAGVEDMTLPHLVLTQALSKFVTEDGMRPGSFVNTLSRKAYTEPNWVEFVPFKMTKYVNLLKNEGGKMVFEARINDELDPRIVGRRFFPETDSNGNTIKANAESVMAFLVMVDGQPVVVKFSKTSHKAGKELVTLAKMAGGDLWNWKYKLAAKKEVKGSNSYYVASVQVAGQTSEDERAAAYRMYQAMSPRAKDVAGQEPQGEEVPF
jgi:hypothetical protein